ncbi:MAG: S41 family peptidase [Pyramidobacter sp.]|jgi:carboxyl-terminal processing protease
MKKLRKYRDLFFGIIIGVAVVSAIPAVYASKGSLSQVAPFTTDSLWLLKQARIIVEAYQVDAASKDISESEMVHGAMRGMLSAWKDPYTRFLDPEQLEEEKTAFEGSFGGLGINITSRDGKILVINPIEGTPADKAGLRPLDEIVRVNDDIVIGWDLDKVVKKLRGDPGTKVTIGIRRKNENNLLDFTIVRDTIKIDTVSSKMLSDDVGYIRLRQFIKTSAADIGKAVIDLKNKKAKGLILDLRNNGGGLLDAACDICDLFIDGGLIVSTRGRVDSANEEYYAHEGVLTDLPLVVLINEGSASASEIVSGALRDRNKTLLVGAKSFGKGSVQVLFNLSDGSGMFVTTARYFTPNGVRIDHVGLTPDIFVKSVWDEEESASEKDVAANDKKNALDKNVDASKKEASDAQKSERKDRQLEKARQTVLRLAAGEKPENLKDPVPAASADVAAEVPAQSEKGNDAAASQSPTVSPDVNVPSSDGKKK